MKKERCYDLQDRLVDYAVLIIQLPQFLRKRSPARKAKER